MEDMNRRRFLGKTLTAAAAGVLAEEIFAADPKPADHPSQQKETDYQTAVKTKYPEQIVIVTAKDSSGKANPMPMGWMTIASDSPPLLAISMGQSRYTAEAIKHSKCFTVSYPSSNMGEAVLFFGTRSGRDTDKFAEFKKCCTEPAKKIDCVLLTDAVANFECRLETQYTVGDHILFIAAVVDSHVNTGPVERLYNFGSRKFAAATPA